MDEGVNLISVKEFLETPQAISLLRVQDALSDVSSSNINEVINICRDFVMGTEQGLLSLVRNIYIYSSVRKSCSMCYYKIIQELLTENDLIKILYLQLHFGFKLGADKLIWILVDNGILNENKIIQDHKRYKPEKTIVDIIAEDDVEALQEIVAAPGTDLNHYYHVKEGNLLTLIQISAFFGSIKCFKYMLLNGADLYKECIFQKNKKSSTITPFAIMGGNIEIIRILEQHNFHTTAEHLKYAIRHHHSEIFQWLLERFPQAISPKNAINCIKYEYIRGLKSFTNVCLEAAFNYSCVADFFEMFDFLKSNYNTNTQYGLSIACRFGCIDIVKNILKDFNFDINHSAKDRFDLPLVNACMGEFSNIVQLLLKCPNIDVNRYVHSIIMIVIN